MVDVPTDVIRRFPTSIDQVVFDSAAVGSGKNESELTVEIEINEKSVNSKQVTVTDIDSSQISVDFKAVSQSDTQSMRVIFSTSSESSFVGIKNLSVTEQAL